MRPRSSPAHAAHRELANARTRLAARDEAIVETQLALARIPAPTGEEHERGRWVEDRFRAIGLDDVHVDDAGNVVGRRAGTHDLPPVVICAHLDTVFPRDVKLEIRREGNRLTGPSVNDNCRGLAVMLALAEEIDGRHVRPPRPIEFVATTGEEGAGNLRGARHYFDTRGRSASAMIALDGAGDERIVHRALGSRRFRVTFVGHGGHSWAAFGAPNAVHAAAAAATRLARLRLPAEPRTSVSVGRIGGGMSVNTIPDFAWLEVDLRSVDRAMLDRYEREVREAVHASCEEENFRRSAGSRPLSAALEMIGSRPCGQTDSAHPLVVAAMEATRLVGRDPDLATASTDANVPISRGIPAIAIGAGGHGGDAHSPHEWFDNSDGPRGVARALTIVMGAAQLAAD